MRVDIKYAGFSATAPWRALAVAYHSHHFACPICIAAGGGIGLRCAAGAALWSAYCEADS